MSKTEKQITVGMPQALYDAVKQQAKEDNRTIPGCIRFVLRRYIEYRKESDSQADTE
ncbi:hypothetical protein AALA82_05195 [Oscillospiraceae bacterium 50-16]|jgi:hypothetical protein|nr:hypothetical protein [Lawsonibacter sp.]